MAVRSADADQLLGDLGVHFVAGDGHQVEIGLEIGIRLALGAARFSVLSAVMKEGIALALGGVVIGLAGALALNHLISALWSTAHRYLHTHRRDCDHHLRGNPRLLVARVARFTFRSERGAAS